MPRVSRMTSVGSSRSTIGCGSLSRNTRTRGLSRTGSMSVIMQDFVLGMMRVGLAGAKQHPEHRHEAAECNGAGHRDDDDNSQHRPGQVLMHGGSPFHLPLARSAATCCVVTGAPWLPHALRS